jgi:hypothetical protein
MNLIRVLPLAITLALGLPSIAPAQVVVNLHPPGADISGVLGIHNGQQVGRTRIGGIDHASVWSGTAASWVDLNPAGSTQSFAWGVHNGQQVGFAFLNTPSLWNGTAASWVNLTPTVATGGQALGVHNGQQVGYVTFGGEVDQHASLWSNTMASWVDLNPAGASYSEAHGVHNGQQVGRAFVDNRDRASLWNGTAASWVNLHPEVAANSLAVSVHNGQQVGYAWVGTIGVDPLHASLWNGTAASWVDLHPAGSTGSSSASGVFNGLQVGSAHVGGKGRASLWSGTAESWVDLSLELTGSWGDTSANSIWSDDMTIYIGGSGLNLDTGRNEALLWMLPVPEPSAILLLTGGSLVYFFRKRCVGLTRRQKCPL